MEAVTAVAVVSGAGHVIELADAGHHSAGVLLLHCLPSRGHQQTKAGYPGHRVRGAETRLLEAFDERFGESLAGLVNAEVSIWQGAVRLVTTTTVEQFDDAALANFVRSAVSTVGRRD